MAELSLLGNPQIAPESEEDKRRREMLALIPGGTPSSMASQDITIPEPLPVLDRPAPALMPMPTPAQPVQPIIPAAAPVAAQPAQGLAAEPQVFAGSVPPPDTQQPPEMPGMLPVQSNETRVSKEYKQEDTNKLDEALKEVKKTREDLVDIHKNVPEEVKAGFNNYIARLTDAQNAISGQVSEQAKAAIADARSKIDAAQNDYVKFQESAKVDPNRYMSSMPSTERAINSMFIFLEGISAAKAMGKGAAVPPVGIFQAQLNKAIDMDIASQKDELNRKESALTANVNRYKENYNLLNSERAAELKTKADALTIASSYLNAQKGKVADQAAVKEIEMKAAQAEADSARALRDANGVSVQEVIKSERPMTSIPKLGIEKKVDVIREISKTHKADDAYVKGNNTITAADQLMSLVKSVEKGNTVDIPMLKGAIAQVAQGGAARGLTDADMRVFGPYVETLDSFAGWIKEKWDGEMTPKVLEDVRQSAKRAKEFGEYVVARRTYNNYQLAKQVPGLDPEDPKRAFDPSDLQIMHNHLQKLQQSDKLSEETKK